MSGPMCTTCGKRRQLTNSAMCLRCWNAWFEQKRMGTKR